MKCKNCGNEVEDNWLSCPFCGTKIEKESSCSSFENELTPDLAPSVGEQKQRGDVDDNVLPSLEGILSSDGDSDLVAGDIAEAKQRMKEEEKAAYQKKLTLARVACIRGNYQQAQAIYDELVSDNAEDINAYIGFVRIASLNYSIIESGEIEEAIRVAKQVTGENDLSKYDKDFAGYVAKRIKCTVNNLRSLGANITELSDGFKISGKEIKGGNAHSYGDHRMAMSMAVANALSLTGGTVDDEQCVEISYPSFWELFI